MNGLSLYEITQAYAALADSADAVEGDPEQWLIAELNKLGGELTKKVAGIGLFVKSLEAEAELIKAEEKRLRGRRAAIERKQAWLESYLGENMKAAHIEKVKDALVTVNFRKCPASVEIIDEKLVPDEFAEMRVERVIDKKKILDHFKATGEILPGTNVITDKENLQIK
jgi:hypothetical protein